MLTQSTTPRTVISPSGIILPAVVNGDTPLDLYPAIEDAFARANGEAVSRATLRLVLEAVRDGGAVVVKYDHGGEISARCLWPTCLSLTKEKHIACGAYCTLRQTVRSFRLDRVLSCHALTTPDDYAGEEG